MRIGALTFMLAGLFVLAAIRLAVLVLIDGPRLSSLAHEEHTTAMRLAAVRGPIVDRDGNPLALSAETRSIFARAPKLLESSTASERVRLAQALALSPAGLEAKLKKPAPFVWLARHLQPERARAAEDLVRRPGPGFDIEMKQPDPGQHTGGCRDCAPRHVAK